MTALALLFPIALLAGLFYANYRTDRETYALLGPGYKVVSLYKRWVMLSLYTAMGLYAAWMVIYGALAAAGRFGDEDWMLVIRGVSWAPIFFVLIRSIRVAAGPNGLAFRNVKSDKSRARHNGVLTWDVVHSLTWDREIGQRSYGATLAVEGRGGLQQVRIYVPRPKKAEIEDLFYTFAPDTVEHGEEVEIPEELLATADMN